MGKANGDSSAFCTGFFLGAVTGGMAALLLAPKSGRDLRADIAEERTRMGERARETAEELKSRGKRARSEAQKAVHAASEGVKETAHILRTGHSRDESPASPPGS